MPDPLPLQAPRGRSTVWTAAITAAFYPWLLSAFHWAVTRASSSGACVLAAFILLAAFGVPFFNLWIASDPTRPGELSAGHVRARRFALIAMTAPTAYVFFGVLSYMLGSPVPDPWVWTPAWLLAGLLAVRLHPATPLPARAPNRVLRVAHGVAGTLATTYILFHLFNHLWGWIGPEAHEAVMAKGRLIYRAAAIEPLLIAVMLFQIGSGLRLAWTWTEARGDRYRLFQLASGIFIAVFILGHMNSVFVFARTFLRIPTDWAFATGAPGGLIYDAWNIRLVPHYALGVFFVLAHLCSGLRVVMLSHRVRANIANAVWWAGLTGSASIAVAIIAGMMGARMR